MEVETKAINIKWNKTSLTINTKFSTVSGLREDIQAQTNVLANRQKLILKGRVLKDEDPISEIDDKAVITLIGNAEKDVIITANTSNVVFVEDLTTEDKIRIMKEKGEDLKFGLANLGNTCYFNSLIQCFGRVDRLKEELKQFMKQTTQANDLNKAFLTELGRLYENLDNATDAIAPHKLVQILRVLNPAFGEQGKGGFKQQDADECMLLMLNTFKSIKNNASEKFSDNLCDELFGISMSISLTNVEEQSEVKNSQDTALKLVCYIDNNTSELVSGLKASLAENVELYSDILQRNTFFNKKQLISRLPPFLNIQFMRFFWKQANEDMFGSKAGKAKILKSVMFSKLIDVYDLCTPDVQEVLKLGRDIETKMLKEDKNYRTDLSYQKKGDNMIPTGRYQLIAVVTHQGRSSEEGHYIGWTHKKDDKWSKFDDDRVSNQNTSDILELKGGGDWHMAYICIYQALEVPFQEI